MHHSDKWRIMVTSGEILDLEPLPINDVHVVVRVERPIKEHAEMLLKAGVPHHGITVRGDVRWELNQLAEFLRMEVISI